MPLLSDSFPKSFTALYSLHKGTVKYGEIKRTLKPGPNGTVVFESITVPAGFFGWFGHGKLSERSVFRYQNGTIKPIKYTFKRSGFSGRFVEVTFDWNNYSVINNINSDPWRMEIKPHTLDKLVYQLAIMFDLKKSNKTFEYSVADGGTLKVYHIVVIGQETLNTPLGNFDTTIIKRAGDLRHTKIWCAANLDYLPVKIEQHDKQNGGQFQALIQHVEGFNLPLKKSKAETQNRSD